MVKSLIAFQKGPSRENDVKGHTAMKNQHIAPTDIEDQGTRLDLGVAANLTAEFSDRLHGLLISEEVQRLNSKTRRRLFERVRERLADVTIVDGATEEISHDIYIDGRRYVSTLFIDQDEDGPVTRLAVE